MAKRAITKIYVEDDTKFGRARIVLSESNGTEWVLGQVEAVKGIVNTIRQKKDDPDF